MTFRTAQCSIFAYREMRYSDFSTSKAEDLFNTAMAATPAVAFQAAAAVSKLDRTISGLLMVPWTNKNNMFDDNILQSLVGDVRLFGHECNFLCNVLNKIVSKAETKSPTIDLNDRIWTCLLSVTESTARTLQQLERFSQSLQEKRFSPFGQHNGEPNQHLDHVSNLRAKTCSHADHIHLATLLINILDANLSLDEPNGQTFRELDDAYVYLMRLQSASDGSFPRIPTYTLALMQYAQEVITRFTAVKEPVPVDRKPQERVPVHRNDLAAEWMDTLESLSRDQQQAIKSDMVQATHIGPQTGATSDFLGLLNSLQNTVDGPHHRNSSEDESNDDLAVDLARSALDTGTESFKAKQWREANLLLEEALEGVSQLSSQQRDVFDLFDMRFKLAVCAYHIREPIDAEAFLMSMVQQPAASDHQRESIYEARHLLAQLCVRMRQIERARSECEKALLARRRLLGKLSSASLESTALMAHIYVLLDNRARAKSCLAMIPEERRNEIVNTVEQSLGADVEHLDFSSLLSRPAIENRDSTGQNWDRQSTSTYESPPTKYLSPEFSPEPAKSSASSLRQPYHRSSSSRTYEDERRSMTLAHRSSMDKSRLSKSVAVGEQIPTYSADPIALDTKSFAAADAPQAYDKPMFKTLSRKEILDNVKCQPRNEIEEAVCAGDHSTLASLLSKRKDFWRSKLRKRMRSERVTALHFAALFGEVDMAHRLLAAGFNVNEVPYGYSTNLTPLHFAIGARQVNMVDYLIKNGARPPDSQSWSNLAEQLMSRSWLLKTMSDSEKEHVPDRIIAILELLLRQGWDINQAFDASRKTVLHQAVAFWTGSYNWDLNLRAIITSFLFSRAANPFQANADGKTPYDLALESGHQDLLAILNGNSEMKQFGVIRATGPYELS